MKKPVQLKVLVAITGVETLAVAVTLILGIIDIVTGNEKSLALSAALDGLIAGFVIWGALITKGLWQLKSWARSSSIFWQSAQLAIAWESFQGGETARPDIAWLLIIPSVVVLVLMFTNPLANLLKRNL
jgi:hypothetical protein